MALAGLGVLALWFDVAPEAEDDFYEWHNREHMPERLGNAGFRSGRRFIAIEGQRKFLVLYETNTSDIPAGPEYLNRVRHRTPWSQRTNLLNPTRAIFKVLFSLGCGQGGFITTIRYKVRENAEEEHRRFLAHAVLPALVDEPAIVGVHLCRVDRHAMSIPVAEGIETRLSAMDDGRHWLIMVEGSRDAASLKRISESALSDAALAGKGAEGKVDRSLFQHQNSLARFV